MSANIKKVDDNGQMKPEYTNDGLHLLGKGYMLWKGNAACKSSL